MDKRTKRTKAEDRAFLKGISILISMGAQFTAKDLEYLFELEARVNG